MRLIDADDLMQEFYNTCMRIEETDNNFQDNKEYITLLNVMDRVNAQPTAYDVDEKVSKIRDYMKAMIDRTGDNVFVYVSASIIEIVKGGAK